MSFIVVSGSKSNEKVTWEGEEWHEDGTGQASQETKEELCK